MIPTCALTFDDGPWPGQTDAVLDLLREYGVRATFCVVGNRIEAPGGADLLRRTVAEGHALANHGWSYDDLGDADPDRVAPDLRRTLTAIRDALGRDHPVPWFRAANGSWGGTAEVAAGLGMRPLGLGNVIQDWDGEDLAVATLVANLRAAITPGSVVLLHDGGGDRSATLAALATVLPEKLAEGYVFMLPR